MIGNLKYIAFAVPNLKASIKQYEEGFGAFVTSSEEFPEQGVQVALVKLPNTLIKLISPLGKESPLDDFLKGNPQGGVHHLCYEVSDMDKATNQLNASGIHIIESTLSPIGSQGKSITFFEPKECPHILIALEETLIPQISEGVEVRPIGHSLLISHGSPDTLRGAGGIGLSIEVDFHSPTPESNKEEE